MSEYAYTKKSIYADLSDYCHIANDTGFIEVTEWYNGEGVDVHIHNAAGPIIVQLTFGEVNAIHKLTKKVRKL